MHPTHTNWHRLTLFTVMALTSACGVEATRTDSALAETSSQALFTTQGYSQQGYSQQGYSQQGTSLVSAQNMQGFSLSSLRLSGETSPGVFSNVLQEGQLVAQRSVLTATSPSLNACSLRTAGGGGLAQACGWSFRGLGTCTAGQWVTVSASQCDANIGAPMVRVCSDFASCEYGSPTMLATAAGVGGWLTVTGQGSCPTVGFTCPATGHFNVLTARASRLPASMTPQATALFAPVFPYYNVRHAGTELKGATLSAYLVDGGTQAFSIGEIRPELKDRIVPYPGSNYPGTTLRYQLQVSDGDGGLADVCGGDSLDYPELGGVTNDGGTGYPVAIPVSGYWDRTGAVNREDPDRFTFSCRPGVVSKCYRWGYRPWEQGLIHDKTYLPPGQVANLHQACTRMARADYCGNGLSYTVLGTNIDLWDNNAPQIQVRGDLNLELKQGMSFEAGWSPLGATCLNHVRWSFAPPEVLNPTTCQVLHNPKKHDAPEICDSQAQAEALGAQYNMPIMFDSSAFNAWDGGMPWYALDAGA